MNDHNVAVTLETTTSHASAFAKLLIANYSNLDSHYEDTTISKGRFPKIRSSPRDKMTDRLEVIFMNRSTSPTTFHIFYYNQSITQDDCVYAEGFHEDWEIPYGTNCEVANIDINLCPYNLNVHGLLNLTSSSLNASEYRVFQNATFMRSDIKRWFC